MARPARCARPRRRPALPRLCAAVQGTLAWIGLLCGAGAAVHCCVGPCALRCGCRAAPPLCRGRAGCGRAAVLLPRAQRFQCSATVWPRCGHLQASLMPLLCCPAASHYIPPQDVLATVPERNPAGRLEDLSGGWGAAGWGKGVQASGAEKCSWVGGMLGRDSGTAGAGHASRHLRCCPAAVALHGPPLCIRLPSRPHAAWGAAAWPASAATHRPPPSALLSCRCLQCTSASSVCCTWRTSMA